jgi:hypothetical protein
MTREHIKYSNEIWNCIQDVYEADRNGLSIQQILKIVQNISNTAELPTRATVFARAKKEKWQRADPRLNLSTATLQKIARREKCKILIRNGMMG